MPHAVFLSYAKENKNVVDAVCARLESRGLPCWYAPRDILPGSQWSASIIDAINGAKIMVLIFSTHSNGSVHVRNEVERAVNRGLHVIPFRIEDVPPCKEIELFISSPHWLDAMAPPIEQHIDKLAETVQVVLAHLEDGDDTPLESVPPPPPPARRKSRPVLMALLLVLILGAAGAALFLSGKGGDSGVGAKHPGAEPPAQELVGTWRGTLTMTGDRAREGPQRFVVKIEQVNGNEIRGRLSTTYKGNTNDMTMVGEIRGGTITFNMAEKKVWFTGTLTGTRIQGIDSNWNHGATFELTKDR